MVSDLEHFLDLPADVPGPAMRLADRLGRMVSAATAGDVGEPWTTAIRCERRPGRRPCAGFIEVVRAEPEVPIRWWCNACDDEGVITGWERSPFDLRSRDLRSAPARRQVVIDVDMAGTLQRIAVLDIEAARVVFRARATVDEVVLLGSADELEALAEHVAAEANHEPNRRRRRVLDAALDRLESAISTT
jgi:hypothetical protein